MSTYECELEIDALLGSDGDDKNLSVEVDMAIVRFSRPPSGGYNHPPESFDPGDDAEFKIDEIRVIGGTLEKPITKVFTAAEFEAFFPTGELILDQANEWAADREHEFYE